MSGELNDYIWVIYALGAFLMFGITNFLLKVASIRGVPSIEGTVILWISTGLVGLAAIIIAVINGLFSPINNPRLSGVNYKNFIIPVVAGITLAMGMYFLKAAVASGKAGPSTAVSASNAALVAILSWMLLNERLSISEVIGMLLYIIAIMLFTIKPLG